MKIKNLFGKKTGPEPVDEVESVTTASQEDAQVPEGKTEEVTEAKKEEPASDNSTVCPKCKQSFDKVVMRENMNVCPACGYHFVIAAERRVKYLVDHGSFKPLKCRVAFANPLENPEYEAKITALQEKTGLDEAVYTGVGKIDGYEAVIGVMSSKFLMGSMGIAVGEKITNAFEYAERKKLPVILFTASGGARMQEGILSLMQMAKTSAAVERFSKNGGLYISVLTHPTTGGVTASFATLGDITLAEPEALIGFAGPRVIEQTIGQKLPEGFQRSEFLMEHGFVDQIVPRDKMRETLAHILRLHCKKGK